MGWLWKTVKAVAKVTVVVAKFIVKVTGDCNDATKPKIDPPRKK
ncbi:hypothetical protein LCGC14_1239480 [marine sediment metagenome]|uniref:Cyclic lactone autoinducer peptide n=1 Tax=marine sediment metagenome TaxID=412755 RepID=A0A0F9LAD8_9ZZZZ